MHGAIGAFSLGVPALLFRTDSRSEMAEEFGIPVLDDREDEPVTIRRAVRAFLKSHRSQSNVDIALLKQFEEERIQRMLCVESFTGRVANG